MLVLNFWVTGWAGEWVSGWVGGWLLVASGLRHLCRAQRYQTGLKIDGVMWDPNMVPNISRFGHHSRGFTSFYRISWDFTMVLAVEPPLLQRGTDRLFSSLGRYCGRNNRPRKFLSISFHLRILRSVQKCGFYPPSHEYFTPGYRCYPGVKRTVSFANTVPTFPEK